jgi:hypothetical protein
MGSALAYVSIYFPKLDDDPESQESASILIEFDIPEFSNIRWLVAPKVKSDVDQFGEDMLEPHQDALKDIVQNYNKLIKADTDD